MSHKNKHTTGYRLHLQRLLFAANDVVNRTFKYPLTYSSCQPRPDFTDVPPDLISAIQHDDLYLKGPSNLVDYLKFKDKPIYSLIDFWLDSLRAGVIFMPSTASLVDFVTRIKDGQSIFKRVIDSADARFTRFFKMDKIIEEIILKNEMRVNKTRNSFINSLTKALKKDLSDAEKDAAQLFIQTIADSFFDNQDRLKITGSQQQNVLWLQSFQLNKNALNLSYNLTFYIFPELAVDTHQSVTSDNLLQIFDEIITKRKNWLQQHHFSDEETKKLLDRLLGLSDNFNAFSNYFSETIKLLQDKNNAPDNVLTLLQKVHPSLDSQVTALLSWLTDKVSYLDKPALVGVNGWHDYRSLLGGKLQSWWTNHKNRAQEQHQQLTTLRQSLPKINKFINTYPNKTLFTTLDDVQKQRKFSIQELLNQLDDLTQDFTSFHYNKKRFSLLESLVKDLRQQLNEYFQLYYKNDSNNQNKKTKIDDIPQLRDFWKLRIYKPRNFYGYAQRENLQKIVNDTIPTIQAGVQLTQHLLTTLQDYPDYSKATQEKDMNKIRPDVGLRRLLNVLANKHKRRMLNTTQFRDFYLPLLHQYISKDTDLNSGLYTFFKSQYSTSNQKEITLPSLDDYGQEVAILLQQLTDFLLSFSVEQLLLQPALLLDWLETAKVVIARFFRWMNQDKEWSIQPFSLNIFPASRDALQELQLTQVKTPFLRFIIMSLVFSEFRNAVTTYSKKQLLSKWNVQIVGSDTKFKLTLLPRSSKITPNNLKELIKNNPHSALSSLRWGVAFPFNSKQKDTFLTLKEKKGKFKLTKESSNAIFHICTSKYHLQFLERLIYKPAKWHNITIRVSEPSLLVEKSYQLSWSNGQLTVAPLSSKKPLLYYVLPLQFSVQRDKNLPSPLSQIKDSLQKNPQSALPQIYFLGADIGEYGIAWSLIKIDEDQHVINIKDYGFFYDKQIHKIQTKFTDIQRRMRTGYLSSSITILADLRTNAIGYLRNALHSQLLKVGGQIIYEANISNFEIGVGRTTKIYDSVKRADVGNPPEMSKSIKSLATHIWGLKKAGKDYSPGWQVGASATSYTCLLCGRTIYSFDDNLQCRLVKTYAHGSLHVFKHSTQNIQLVGYYEGKDLVEKVPFNKVKRYTRNFARPPLVKTSSQGNHSYPSTTQYHIIDKKILTPRQLQQLKDKRGNSTLFICPFVDCHAVVDADVQASVVIALRGYFRVKYWSNKQEFESHQLQNEALDFLHASRLTGRKDFIYYSPKH